MLVFCVGSWVDSEILRKWIDPLSRLKPSYVESKEKSYSSVKTLGCCIAKGLTLTASDHIIEEYFLILVYLCNSWCLSRSWKINIVASNQHKLRLNNWNRRCWGRLFARHECLTRCATNAFPSVDNRRNSLFYYPCFPVTPKFEFSQALRVMREAWHPNNAIFLRCWWI